MIRLGLLWIIGVACSFAQFRLIEVTYQDVGCASCIKSLAERLGRVRGVESADLNSAAQTLKLRLAESNRVRLEQVRDLIEQDGTKALRARVEASGELSGSEAKWTFEPKGSNARYTLEPEGVPLASGTSTIAGEVRSFHPTSNGLVIHLLRLSK